MYIFGKVSFQKWKNLRNASEFLLHSLEISKQTKLSLAEKQAQNKACTLSILEKIARAVLILYCIQQNRK